MKDMFGREILVGSFLAYPSMNYTEIKICMVTRLFDKTFEYKYFSWHGYTATRAHNPKNAIVIDDILPDSFKEKLRGEQ